MPMTGPEYSHALDLVTAAARLLLLVRTDQLLDDLASIETLAPILEPTAYRNGGMINLDDQRRLVEAAHQLRQVAVDIREREGVSP